MKIRALQTLVIKDSETGKTTSIAFGAVADVDSTLGNQLITDGLAEAYTLISPTGSITITENGTVDVTEKASAVVNVPNPSTGKVSITSTEEVDCSAYATAQVVDANLIAENIKKDVTILGVTGTYEPSATE